MTIFRNWQQHASHILWVIFISQYVIWLSEFWLSVTSQIVHISLWTVLIIQIAIPLPWVFKRILQFIAIFVIHMIILDFQVIPFSMSSPEGFLQSILTPIIASGQWIFQNINQFLPFLWFALVPCLIYLFLAQAVRTKGILYTIFIYSVILFAIIDSFTFYILWDQTAIIILCGLLLATIQHFYDFKKKHPQSWAYFKEYPGMISALVIGIITVTMVAGIFAPSVRPLLVDPYTAWKHLQGETVQTFGKGFTGLSGPDRDSSSGYRRDDSSLGGSFQFDFAEVMTVQTSYRSYMRGETRSVYTGEGWEMSEAELNPDLIAVFPNDEFMSASELEQSSAESIQIEQTIIMKNDLNYPVLFGAYSINKLIRIDEDEEAGEETDYSGLQWSTEFSILQWFNREEYPKSYQLESQMLLVDPNDLREISRDTEYEGMQDYLQLPESLPGRVVELALVITEEENNVYDTVKAIENYLKFTFPYTNQPDESLGESDDFVDRFLFEIQEGYCDYYSTAMVVMSRSLGIPTRWVKGYASGSLPIDDLEFFLPEEALLMIGERDEGGLYTIRNSDAHSWVEVYFEGFGWIPFEPTAGFVLPSFTPDEVSEEFEFDLSAPVEVTEDGGGGVLEDLSTSMKFFVFAAIVILVVSIILYVRRSGLISFITELRKNQSELPQNHKVVSEFNRLLKYAGKKGYSREEHETVREMLARWSKKHNWLIVDMESLMKIFERAKYSQQTVSQNEYMDALRLCKKLREAMR